MAKIQSQILVKKGREEIFNLLKDMERFPEFMRDVKSLHILEHVDNKLITKWQIEIENTAITWKEEDVFDDKNYTLKFHMLEGDYQEYQGSWRLEPHSGTTRIKIDAVFDWGIPVLERFVANVLERKARLAFEGMLKSIKKRLEVDLHR
ncbi:MAG: SRPBCC family protein [Candidatus Omnitrophota bacterium]